MFKKIDHLGIAVENLDDAVKLYASLLGKEPDHYEDVEEQKVKTAFFSVGESQFELLESTSPEGPIGKFIAKNGRGGIHHICVQVDDIRATIATYQEAGVKLIDDEPRVGAHNKLVAFVHPKSTGGVLLELSQDRTSS
jgi:methylmalonyl-CoA/ethylmalonyl-CoA epimerase